MTTIERSRAVILPFRPTALPQAQHRHVLAVVGGTLDNAVINLARALAREGHTSIDLLVLIEVPATLPLMAYGHWLRAQGVDAILDDACATCGDLVDKADIILCRSAGRALAAEAQARGSADLVIGAASGGWWARRRAQAAIGHVQKHAGCRVFVVHVPPAPDAEQRAHHSTGT